VLAQRYVPMERIKTLRDQAVILRTLAASFDIENIRDRLLNLAQQCDDLADSLERDLPRSGA
jgi:hypothetical protein